MVRLFSLICALLIASPSWASIGSVTELTGAATIKRGKESIAVTKGVSVEQNDKVETKNGKLKITFKDNTVVSVTEHSALVIDDFVYDPKNAAGSKLGLKAAGGTVRYVSGAIAGANPNAVKINTPTAAIAVRGTDFVMSVNEIGSSMVILMPSCEDGAGSRGVTCGSGKIEVESGPNRISMDRPYQATLVESVGQPPTPPVTVNLFNTPIGNNLQISPPKTMSGASVVAAARAAAMATGVTREAKKEDKDDKDSGGEEKQATTDKKQSSSKRIARAASAQSSPTQETAEAAVTEEEKTTTAAEVPEAPTVTTDLAAAVAESSVIAVAQSSSSSSAADKEETTTTSSTAAATEAENPYVKKLWKDKSETRQVGWLYESLAPNNRNYVNVSLPVDTKVQVIVTQDMQTNGWNFNSMKAQGQIVINQVFR